MRSRNLAVQNALNAMSLKDLASMAQSDGFFKVIVEAERKRKASPEYKAELERKVRRAYGDKAVDEWIAALKKAGMWKD